MNIDNKSHHRIFKFILCLTLLSPAVLRASEWRTPHNSSHIKQLRVEGTMLTPRFLGVTGTVGKIHLGYKNKPIYLLTVDDDLGKETILIGSLFNSDIKPGHRIEILFDAILVSPKDKIAQALTEEIFMGLGLCQVNLNTGKALSAKPTQAMCNKWYLASFPKHYKDRR